MHIETTTISEVLLKQIIEFIGLKLYSIKFIKYSQNFVYEINDEDGVRILRITSDKHRTRAQIAAELQWIDYLKDGGLNACAGIKRNGDNKIYSYTTPSDILHCVLFEKAPGRPVNYESLNDDLYYMHGALVGKIQRLAHHAPVEVSKNRFDWQNNRLFTTDLQAYLPDYVKKRVAAICIQLIDIALKLPRTDRTYGLIHFDLHYDNFCVNGNELWLYDFDNCSNGYFINDTAKALWNSVFTYHRISQYMGKSPFFENPAVDQILETVWKPFWMGYRDENEIIESWFEQIPLFFELTHIKEFVHHYRKNVPYRNEEFKKIFAYEQKQIEQRVIPVSFDFTSGRAIPREISKEK